MSQKKKFLRHTGLLHDFSKYILHFLAEYFSRLKKSKEEKMNVY